MMSAACEIGVCSSAMFMFYFIPFVCSPTEVFGLEHHDKKEQIEKRDLTFSATPYTTACKCAAGTKGKILASTTRKFVVP